MFWPSEIRRDSNGDIAAVHGQSLPGLTASVAYLSDIYRGQDDWGTAQMYNFLSANTHPTIQIYRSRMQAHTDDTEVEVGPVAHVRLVLNDLRKPRDLTYLALRCYVQMWRLAAGYYGLDPNAEEITTIGQEVDALRSTD